VILGKTVTCEFAGLTPNVTCNPHDPTRTPGGSSSGSAAAVADNMVHIAFGTQTGGSVLRPASFCGVVGYKPTYNIIGRGGMKFAAESRDTIGLFARSVEDVDLVASVLTGREPANWHDRLPKIALCRTHLWEHAGSETKAPVEDAARRLDVAREAILPREFEALAEARTVINPFERARALAHEWNTNAQLISPGLAAQIEKGLMIPHARYTISLQRMKECRDLWRRGHCAGALRHRRSAQRVGNNRRADVPGVLDRSARSHDHASHASRPERHAGRHSADRPPLWRRTASRFCPRRVRASARHRRLGPSHGDQ